MPIEWESTVRQKRRLTVFGTPEFMKSAVWGQSILGEMLDEWKKLSKANKLDIELVQTSDPPDDNDSHKGANVQIDISNGSHSFMFEGTRHARTMPGPPEIAGKTHHMIRGFILRAFVFVPELPTTKDKDASGTSIDRTVTKEVRVFLGLHELLHALGLNETDPGHFGGPQSDLFMSGGSVSTRTMPGGVKVDLMDLGGGRFAPPFLMNSKTVGMIKANWA